MLTPRLIHWQLRHSSRRTYPITLLLAVFAVVLPGSADAGPLDWLFGRSSTYSANYPYAGYPAGGYSAGVQPIGAPQLVGATTSAGSPYSAQYGSQVGFPTTVSNPALTSGTVQAQRPSFPTVSSLSSSMVPVQTFDNPSVYTGRPAAGLAIPQTSYRLPTNGVAFPATGLAPASMGLQAQAAYANRVPISQTLRGNAGLNPIVSSSAYSPGYSSYYGSTAPVAAVNYNAQPTFNAPLTLAPTNAVLPLGRPAARPFGSGLARFFNSLLGRRDTNYTSSYYRAPVTYYRPISSVDPMSGTTVTVQQPCSSYVQQLQRVPTNSFLPLGGAASIPLQSGGVCSTGMSGASQFGYAQPSYGQPGFDPLGSTLPGTFAPPSGVGQVGAQLDPSSYGVSPIPSYAPQSQFGGSQGGFGNGQPLTGSGQPLTGNATGSLGGDPADRANVEQPRLEANRPNTSFDTTQPRQAGSSGSDAEAEYGLGSAYADGMYRDDLDQYANPDPEYGGLEEDDSILEDSDSPIRLSPPVTRKRPADLSPRDGSGLLRNRSGLLRNEEHFTRKTPATAEPSRQLETPRALQAPDLLTRDDSVRKFSSVRPIGAPEDFTPPVAGDGFRARRDSAVEAPRESSRQTDWMSAPKLPRPNTRRPFSSDSLTLESDARASSVRTRSRDVLTVPVREATTRQSIRQVAAWEDAAPVAAQRATLPAQQRPARESLPLTPRRSSGGWVPNR